MKVSTCGIVTYPPTDNGFHDCQKIPPLDDIYWDPSNNLFEISLLGKEYRTSSIFHKYIHIVESREPCSPPMIQCRYDLGIHEFERVVENDSIELDQYLMVDRLISKFWFNITRSVFVTLYR